MDFSAAAEQIRSLDFTWMQAKQSLLYLGYENVYDWKVENP